MNIAVLSGYVSGGPHASIDDDRHSWTFQLEVERTTDSATDTFQVHTTSPNAADLQLGSEVMVEGRIVVTPHDPVHPVVIDAPTVTHMRGIRLAPKDNDR